MVASLKASHVAPSTMLRKLAAYERQNQIDVALQEIGEIERTLFMLDWLESSELRRRCQAGLNKSEQRHVLTQAICTFRQGRMIDRTHEALQYRASGPNLVIAAIVYWNSTYIADAVRHLRPRARSSIPSCYPIAHRSAGSILRSWATSCGTAQQSGRAASRSKSSRTDKPLDRSRPVLLWRCLAWYQRLALNKGEAENALKRAISFHRIGRIRDTGLQAQGHRASALNLVASAIVLCNTTYLEAAKRYLNGSGRSVPPDLLQHISPLGWQHINLTGDYLWTDPAGATAKLRPLRQRASGSAPPGA